MVANLCLNERFRIRARQVLLFKQLSNADSNTGRKQRMKSQGQTEFKFRFPSPPLNNKSKTTENKHDKNCFAECGSYIIIFVQVTFQQSPGSNAVGWLASCLTPQQQAGVSVGRACLVVHAATLCQTLQTKLAISSSHGTLTPG